MANVNVNRGVTDQFYRYKMPRLIAKVEGRGNGIKTVIVNMHEVAKALSRPPTYTTKYFGCELGAQTQFDIKNDRYIVNGAHDAPKLQDLLDGFIKKFVLCPECDNPETNLAVNQKKAMIYQRCIACGHQGNIDMRHKVTTYILKNPPDVDPAVAGQSKKDKKKEKKGKDQVNGDASPEPSNEREESEELQTPTSYVSSSSYDDDVDWGEDVSDAAVQQRMEELSMAAKKLAVSEDIEKTLQERLDIFYEMVKKRKVEGKLSGLENANELVQEAERLDVKDKATLILVEIVYDEAILQQIKLYRTLFLRFTNNNPKGQRYMIGGLEQLVGKVYKDALMPKVAHILQSLYQNDILDEEIIIDWDKKGASKKYVNREISKEIHSKAAPFIRWLQEAEEESSESEEEDEAVEVVYSNTDKVGAQVVKKEEVEDEADDDIDIDAI